MAASRQQYSLFMQFLDLISAAATADAAFAARGTGRILARTAPPSSGFDAVRGAQFQMPFMRHRRRNIHRPQNVHGMAGPQAMRGPPWTGRRENRAGILAEPEPIGRRER
jgi:hypothetical protein